MKKLLTSCILLLPFISRAQVKTFQWNDGVCEMKSYYDSKKYTARQLEQTCKLWQEMTLTLNTDATAFNLEKLYAISLDSLVKEYREVKTALVRMDIVRQPYWENLRKAKLRQVDQEYALKKVTIESYKNPEALRTYTKAAKCQQQYADALIAGGETLLSTWEALIEEKCKHNGSPENLRREFREQNASPRRLEYARMCVTTFGWWNCANDSIEYVDANSMAQNERFRKLFSKTVNLSCDDPD